MSATAPLQVTGTCPVCKRETTQQAPPGRITWRGDCPFQGCNGRVLCRRPRAGADQPVKQPVNKPVDGPATAPAKRTPRKVVKVDGYQRRAGEGSGPAGVPAADRRTAAPDGQQRQQPPAAGDGAPDGGTPAEPGAPPRAAEPETRGTGRRGHPYGDIFGW